MNGSSCAAWWSGPKKFSALDAYPSPHFFRCQSTLFGAYDLLGKTPELHHL